MQGSPAEQRLPQDAVPSKRIQDIQGFDGYTRFDIMGVLRFVGEARQRTTPSGQKHVVEVELLDVAAPGGTSKSADEMQGVPPASMLTISCWAPPLDPQQLTAAVGQIVIFRQLSAAGASEHLKVSASPDCSLVAPVSPYALATPRGVELTQALSLLSDRTTSTETFTSEYSGGGKALPFDVDTDAAVLVSCHLLDSVAENVTEEALCQAPVLFQINHAHMDVPTGRAMTEDGVRVWFLTTLLD